MQQRAISHFCQNCRAANPLGQEYCQRCGTRLMLIVRPPSMRVDFPETTPHEEHLLERLTILENTMARLAERLEQGLKRSEERRVGKEGRSRMSSYNSSRRRHTR